jgi:hypothetical protein
MKPHVLIVGGFMTLPWNYLPLRRRLLARGASSVTIAPVWPMDWGVSSILGMGQVMRRTRLAILRTYRASDRQPLIVVAHSGGGIAARLAMSSVPYHGQAGGVDEAVGCLVTLGTPHGLSHLNSRYHHAGHEAVEFLDRVSPGAFFAPRTAYLTVGSKYERAAFTGPLGWLADQVFSVVVGDNSVHAGDGIVPAAVSHLDGATQITFDDARHGFIGGNWYGADRVVERWWPTALGLWHEALAARHDQGVLGRGSGTIQDEHLELEVAGWSSGSSSGS